MSRPELSSVVYVRFYDVSCLYESLLSREGECVLATESRQVMLIPTYGYTDIEQRQICASTT